MSAASALADANKVIARLRDALTEKDTQIAQLNAELWEAKEQIPWITDACGDDLWDL